jgi:hypothetical protein
MIILGTTNPLLQFLIHISKIEQKMKKIKQQICRKFIWTPCEPLITIIKAISSNKWERYNDAIVKPFCIPLWISNNNLHKQIKSNTILRKIEWQGCSIWFLCELLTTIMKANSCYIYIYTMMKLQKIHFASPCELSTTIYISKFIQEMKNT